MEVAVLALEVVLFNLGVRKGRLDHAAGYEAKRAGILGGLLFDGERFLDESFNGWRAESFRHGVVAS